MGRLPDDAQRDFSRGSQDRTDTVPSASTWRRVRGIAGRTRTMPAAFIAARSRRSMAGMGPSGSRYSDVAHFRSIWSSSPPGATPQPPISRGP